MLAGDDRELVTITLRRTHVWLAVVLSIGFALGYGAATLRSKRLSASVAAATPNSNGPLPTTAPLIKVSIAGRPATGPERAPVTVVEFTDYQCPFCARHFKETYEELLAANGGQVRYVVRNFPVASLHPDAQKAAEAAECAFDQGKFWEYHAALFERSPRVPLDSLKRIARQLGLNTARFTECLDSGSKEAVVRDDVKDARRYGVRATPTFFINGRILVGIQPIAVFEAEIDRAIQQR